MVDGGKIRRLREAEGLTIAELATKLYVAYSMLAAIELGHREPSVKLLSRLSGHFGCTMDELIRREP